MRNSRVDYVESRLDEAIRSLKEANEKSEARLAADREAMEARLAADRQAMEAKLLADREAMEARLSTDREIAESRQQATETRLENEHRAAESRLAADREEFKEERKEWRSTKRWLYLNFGGVIALIITVVLAILNGYIQ